jgi:hypothetical protein
MWPVLVEQFKFELWINDTGGEVELIILFVYFHRAVLGVLECVGKL